MEVNWKNDNVETPILYSKRAEWTGFDIRHLRVLPGELVEQTYAAHEINVTLAGSIKTQKHSATGKWLTSRAEVGSVCIIPAGQPTSSAWDAELECLTIMLNPAFVAQTALEQNLSANIELIQTHERNDPLIQHIALTLLAEADSSESFGRMYAESLAQVLILHLLKNYTSADHLQEIMSGGLSGYRLRRALEFINENLEEDLSLSEVAEAVGLSQYHFARAFRRSTGLTPQQYLVQQRINLTKELLLNGDLPLVEVSIQAGFKNQSHFTTLFRKFTGFTPKTFREAKHR